MKAAVMHEFGDFDALKHEDIERPRPKPGHVLIKVLAAGVERLDHYIISVKDPLCRNCHSLTY